MKKTCKNCKNNHPSGVCTLLEQDYTTVEFTKEEFTSQYCDSCGYQEHGCSIESSVCVHPNIRNVELSGNTLVVSEVSA